MTQGFPEMEVGHIPETPCGPEHTRLSVVIRGAVQGVGFRPFIYRLATEMRLSGWVSNSVQGVMMEVEGDRDLLRQFLLRIEKERPAISFIQSLESSWLDPIGYHDFSIRESGSVGARTTLVLPDIATCPECLDDVFNPGNRRHLYPFTNCTNCGPRFTIIESLPYDRANTSMRIFPMCPECRREYEDPRNRRFHAQPNACPVCGPRVELWDRAGNRRSANLHAMLQAIEALRDGNILAVKGLGGFHLLVDARNEQAVQRLRDRKRREEKPFALMYPSLEQIKSDCLVSDFEERLLRSPESPIVLVRRRTEIRDGGHTITLNRLADNIAPSNPYLGIMLPYTPLHHILMREIRSPLVATSGNLSDEPICIDEREALLRLGAIADLFLVHNRPIVRHVDDSIVRMMAGRELVLRRSRGYAPLPVAINSAPARPILAVGAHLKNTVAISNGTNVFVSQHIGDLETEEAHRAFRRTTADLKTLYDVREPDVVCDAHPDYLSSRFAHSESDDATTVQHHYAHVASCMAENQLDGAVLGISWDGTGYGLDGSIWGGEFLVTNDSSFERVGSFAQFRLPGGDVAVREPRRSALGVLYEVLGEGLFEDEKIASLDACSTTERQVFHQMLERGLNAPKTSSVGRLFDAVASILGIRQSVRFEGQAAMELEFLALEGETDEHYPFEWSKVDSQTQTTLVNWRPTILGILKDVRSSVDIRRVSAKFHNSLAEIIVDAARRFRMKRVVLSGGCFQNVYLTERSIHRLQQEGFRPYWHQRIPPNDGGISLGQIYASVRVQSNASEMAKGHRLEEVPS